MKHIFLNPRILAIATLFLIIQFVLISYYSSLTQDERFSIYNQSDNGYVALSKTLKDLNYTVKTLDTSFYSAMQEKSIDSNAIFISPTPRRAYTPSEWKQVYQWVSEGNVFICMGWFGIEIPKRMRDSTTFGVENMYELYQPILNQVHDTILTLNSFYQHYLPDSISIVGYENSIRYAPMKKPVRGMPLLYSNEKTIATVMEFGKGLILFVGIDHLFSHKVMGQNEMMTQLALDLLLYQNNLKNPIIIFDEYHQREQAHRSIASVLKQYSLYRPLVLLGLITLLYFLSKGWPIRMLKRGYPFITIREEDTLQELSQFYIYNKGTREYLVSRLKNLFEFQSIQALVTIAELRGESLNEIFEVTEDLNEEERDALQLILIKKLTKKEYIHAANGLCKIERRHINV